MGGGRVEGKLALRGFTLSSDKTRWPSCVIFPAGKRNGAKLQPAGCLTLTYDLADGVKGETTTKLQWTELELQLLIQLSDEDFYFMSVANNAVIDSPDIFSESTKESQTLKAGDVRGQTQPLPNSISGLKHSAETSNR